MFFLVWLSVSWYLYEKIHFSNCLMCVSPQQSFFNRLTESVKNIVPQWLQNYFSRNEDVCTCSAVRREAPQGPKNRDDDNLICADEESTNIRRGRITPEPTLSNTEGK